MLNLGMKRGRDFLFAHYRFKYEVTLAELQAMAKQSKAY